MPLLPRLLPILALPLAACSAARTLPPGDWVALGRHHGHVWHARTGGPAGPGNGVWSADAAEWTPSGVALRFRDGRGVEILTPLPKRRRVEICMLVSTDVWRWHGDLVAGIFVYRDDSSEFDLELGRWGDAGADHAQFVVAPPSTPGHLHRFDVARLEDAPLCLTWRADGLDASLDGHTWRFRGAMPAPDGHALHLNVWARGPVEGEAEVRVSGLTVRKLR